MNSTDKPWVQDPVLSRALRYWHSKCTADRLPARADIDPLDLDPALLPHVVLTDVVEVGGRRRFRFRLSGTAVSMAAGLELTGQFIDTLNPNKQYAAYIEGLYNLAIEARRPVYSESLALAARASATRATRRILCPLSSDGKVVDMCLGVQTFGETGGIEPPSLTYADTFRAGPTIVIHPGDE
jgi:hypothetical protein